MLPLALLFATLDVEGDLEESREASARERLDDSFSLPLLGVVGCATPPPPPPCAPVSLSTSLARKSERAVGPSVGVADDTAAAAAAATGPERAERVWRVMSAVVERASGRKLAAWITVSVNVSE